mmetsp:Transcript_22488/g.62763  ORF Transcript_22488/g.62763 Transcript_22488/m.62763 type:complete len:326 (-) Transcript_22488:1084-2061(-)
MIHRYLELRIEDALVQDVRIEVAFEAVLEECHGVQRAPQCPDVRGRRQLLRHGQIDHLGRPVVRHRRLVDDIPGLVAFRLRHEFHASRTDRIKVAELDDTLLHDEVGGMDAAMHDAYFLRMQEGDGIADGPEHGQQRVTIESLARVHEQIAGILHAAAVAVFHEQDVLRRIGFVGRCFILVGGGGGGVDGNVRRVRATTMDECGCVWMCVDEGHAGRAEWNGVECSAAQRAWTPQRVAEQRTRTASASRHEHSNPHKSRTEQRRREESQEMSHTPHKSKRSTIRGCCVDRNSCIDPFDCTNQPGKTHPAKSNSKEPILLGSSRRR